MNKLFTGIASITLAVTLAACGSSTAPQVSAPVGASVSVNDAERGTVPGAYLVELKAPPASGGLSAQSVSLSQQALLGALERSGIEFTERVRFGTLVNAISINTSSANVDRIAALEGVASVTAVRVLSLPPTESVQPDLANAVSLTGVNVAQNELGLTGQGVKVGIIDSGIDLDHPAFAGRVVAQYDFAGDAYNANPTSPTYSPIPVPDPIADDCGGHGTHVAGIVGAGGSASVKGVAPQVSFGAYRVFGCDGSTDDEVVIAALERAKQDGMQVVNMSLGSSFGYPGGAYATAITNLTKAGVSVVVSAGNSGIGGVYAVGSPSVNTDTISVASFNNTAITLNAFRISPDNLAVGYQPTDAAAPTSGTSGTGVLAKTGTTTTTNDACAALAANSLTGKIVLIRRGTCSFVTKIINAQDAGASAVLLYNNAPDGPVNPNLAGPSKPITIPVVGLTAQEGAMLDGRIAGATPVTLTWTNEKTSTTGFVGAGLASGFSSLGPSADLSFKPEIGAPGGFIYSTYPLEKGGYTTLSGTSMAAPHVAGIIALMLQAKPSLNVDEIRTRLFNTAVPQSYSVNPALGLDMVHKQGAGMANVVRALGANTLVRPNKLALGEFTGFALPRVLTLQNTGNTPVTYTLTNRTALGTVGNPLPTTSGGTINVPTTALGATATFSSTTVTVPARGGAVVTVSLTPSSSMADNTVYGGYIEMTPNNKSGVVRVPYMGYKGDYQAIQALTPTGNGFPWLVKVSGGQYLKQSAGAVYTLQGSDIPQFLFHLDHTISKMELVVSPVGSVNVGYKVIADGAVPRSASVNGFYSISWAGNLFPEGTTPYNLMAANGQYTATLRVLKAAGDVGNAAHWEQWTSPAFEIRR